MLEAVALFVMLHHEDDLPNIKLNRADNLWWESFLSSFPGWFACSSMLDTFVIQSSGIGAREQESMRAWTHGGCWRFLILWHSSCMLEAVALFVMLHQEDDLPNIKLNRADNLWWESFLSSFPGWFVRSSMLDTFVIHSIGIGARDQESMNAWWMLALFASMTF